MERIFRPYGGGEDSVGASLELTTTREDLS